MRQIPTTHVGSLPRGNELTPLLLARDQGKPYDAATLERLVQAAVEDAVEKQQAAGVSIVSDGELGKVGYATYIKERLSGFGGNVARKPALDLASLPELRRKLALIMGEQEFVRASCVGPVQLVNLDPCRDDIRRFCRALEGRSVRGFLNAASPGLITAFQPKPRKISRGSRERHAPGVQRHRRERRAAAARLSGPRHGASHRLPGPE
jgi:5-methyltetrahydropteroyltriglutamate--homocysteine methyltransferase